MYFDHFGLKTAPFSITPAPRFFYSGAGRGKVLDALLYAASRGDGLIKVTSEVGSGKTMLCRMMIEHLPPWLESIYLPNPAASREELVSSVADELGIQTSGLLPPGALKSVQDRLIEKYAKGKRVVVILDEAHAMPCEALEELRLLYNLESGSEKLLTIVLFGQPELDEKLAAPRMRQLRDRIVHQFSVAPLSRESVRDYLGFRMRMAGYPGESPFSVAACAKIHRISRGFMRRIHVLADKALLAAYVEGARRIEARHVGAAAKDSGYAVGTSGRRMAAALLFLLFFVSADLSGPMLSNREDPLAGRLAASLSSPHNGFTVKLFSVGKKQREWLVRFLREARGEIDFTEIYVYPQAKERYLVVYGAYPTRIEAEKALKSLPETYRRTYRPSVVRLPKIRIA